jgi:hypothetical protein
MVIFDIARFAKALDYIRQSRDITWRAVGRESGVSSATVCGSRTAPASMWIRYRARLLLECFVAAFFCVDDFFPVALR